MKYELSVEEIHSQYDKFTQIYIDGDEENKLPENTPMYVYCSNDKDVAGYVECQERDDLGFEELIAKAWILEDDLLKLLGKE